MLPSQACIALMATPGGSRHEPHCRDPQARVDFFAYLVLFKYGGVFASIDCTCEQPIQELILATDDLLTGLQVRSALFSNAFLGSCVWFDQGLTELCSDLGMASTEV